MVTDKELKDAFNEYALKAHDIELDLYRKEIIYARHEKIEMDEQPFNYGFHAGAKWMQEKMREEEECTWCGYMMKKCECKQNQEYYDNKDKV